MKRIVGRPRFKRDHAREVSKFVVQFDSLVNTMPSFLICRKKNRARMLVFLCFERI